jgi:tRNA-2-methylthio-N6-dimethylallyladenosine synthase
MEILVEGYGKRNEQLTGRTTSNKVVNFINNNNIMGSIVKVKIQYAFANSLQGILMNSNP